MDCTDPNNPLQTQEIGSEKCQTQKLSSVNKYEFDVEYVPVVKDEEGLYLVPEIGAEFVSEDHAYECYSRYAVSEGFSIRKDFVNRSRVNNAVVSRRYTCHRQGYGSNKRNAGPEKPWREARTGCRAHMTIARQPNGKFRAIHFENEHNHGLATPSTVHLLPSQKRLSLPRLSRLIRARVWAATGFRGWGLGLTRRTRRTSSTVPTPGGSGSVSGRTMSIGVRSTALWFLEGSLASGKVFGRKTDGTRT